MMYNQLYATELSMRGMPGNALWSSQCELTRQWDERHLSDWETVAMFFPYLLKTPTDRGAVVAGPEYIPVRGWTTVEVDDVAVPGACQPTVPLKMKYPDGKPAAATDVWLEHGDRVIYQGKTGEQGEIELVGAALGDTAYIVVRSGGTLYHYAQSMNACSSATNLHAPNSGSFTLILEPTPFDVHTSVLPGDVSAEAQVAVTASTVLSGVPEVTLYQDGITHSVPVTMTFDNGLGLYKGTVDLDQNFPALGQIQLQSKDLSGRELIVFSNFGLLRTTGNQTQTILSADGQAELMVFPDSFSHAGSLSLASAQQPGALPADLVLVSGPYQVRGNSTVSVANGLALTLIYPGSTGVEGRADLSKVKIYQWDASLQSWQALTSTIFPDQGQVSASITDFGIYAAMGERQYLVYLPTVLKK